VSVSVTTVNEWEARRYERIFDATCRYLERRRVEFGFSIADLEALLENAYQREGNDWLGRGRVKNLDQAAEIAAYEQVLAQWREQERIR
jgi:hypothetical protein